MKKTPFFFCVLLVVGCISNNPHDPYENYNRGMYSFNSRLDRNLLKPAAEGYRYITPKPARTVISNFFDNFRDVYSAGSNLLRAKPEATLNDIMRVALNTTFGLGGLIDVGSLAGLKNNKNTFGDTLATWGWKESNYLVLPVLGPSTTRDGIGTAVGFVAIPDYLMYSHSWETTTANVVKGISTREKLLDFDDTLQNAALDEYSYIRDAFMQMRNKQLGLATTDQTEDFNIDDLVSPSKQPISSNQEASDNYSSKDIDSTND